MRQPSVYEQRARELCAADGIDPESRVPYPGKPSRTMPAWVPYKIKAEQEELASIAASALPLRGPDMLPHINLRPENQIETDNLNAVAKTMIEIMRLPTIVDGAIMPDACPVGKGEIPVGGVVATKEAIHPGFHSADICCSMAVSIFSTPADRGPGKEILDAGMKISHFGGGGRPHSHDMQCSNSLLAEFESNRFLSNMIEMARKHFGTQGDGNHFFYVGRVASTGQTALVTHHGSRAPGATLYKLGMDVAEDWRRKLCPEAPKQAAWIPSETRDGEEYWKALQIIRTWTKKNHFAIHDAVSKHLGLRVVDRFWNEHNFVFRKPDGLFYHAKGATPAFPYWAADVSDHLTLIPLNMAQPILIASGLNAPHALGFAPHGAGRNMSRTAYERSLGEMAVNADHFVKSQTPGLDVRFFCGVPDLSELPGAYKNADAVRAQIDEFGLAEIVDTIEPIGTIMAGDWQADMPWRKKRQKKVAEATAQ